MREQHSVDQLTTIARFSARIHAATAELAALAAAFDDSQQWRELGVRSCAHALSINAGFDLVTAAELVRVGHALKELPLIAAAFRDGRLSFDKVRALTKVAVAADDEMWLEVGLHASGAQLRRICLAVRRTLVDSGNAADDALANRALRTWWRDDGMLELTALLTPEDGAVVMAALEAATHDIAEERRRLNADSTAPDPAPLTRPALRADALTRICEVWTATASKEPVLAPTRQMVVHVDVAVLTGEEPAGRCHVEDGPSLSSRSAQWLGCDADVVALVERDGAPIDVRRLRRLISPRQRLALQARDQGCRYPGCSVPAARTEGHHIRHWPKGRTELRNLASLCRFHHRRHHEGKFDIRVLNDGSLQFVARDGTLLQPHIPSSPDGELAPVSGDTTPVALSGGASMDFGWAVSVLSEGSVWRRQRSDRAGP